MNSFEVIFEASFNENKQEKKKVQKSDLQKYLI